MSAAAVLAVFGCWVATTPERHALRRERPVTLRRLFRYSFTAAVVLAFTMIVLFPFYGHDHAEAFEVGFSLFILLLGLSIVSFLLYVFQIAIRLNDRWLAFTALVLDVWIAIVTLTWFLLVSDWFDIGFNSTSTLATQLYMWALTLIIPWGPPVAALLFLGVMPWYAMRLKQAARAARESWAGYDDQPKPEAAPGVTAEATISTPEPAQAATLGPLPIRETPLTGTNAPPPAPHRAYLFKHVTFEADGRIASDIACTHCRYNLRGLTYDDTCAECGHSVKASLRASQAFADPNWVQRIRRGIDLLVVAFFLTVIVIPVTIGIASRRQPVLMLVAMMLLPVPFVVAGFGTWRFTTAGPGEDLSDSRWRWVLRWATLGLGLAASVLVLVAPFANEWVTAGPIVATFALASLVALAFGKRAATVADRMLALELATHLRLIALGWCAWSIGVAVLVLGGIVRPDAWDAELVLGWAAFIVAVWGIVLLLWGVIVVMLFRHALKCHGGTAVEG
jgi:hypothetical protein